MFWYGWVLFNKTREKPGCGSSLIRGYAPAPKFGITQPAASSVVRLGEKIVIEKASMVANYNMIYVPESF